MRRVSGDEESSDSEFFGASLMDFVWHAVCEFIIFRPGMSRKYGLVFHRLSCDELELTLRLREYLCVHQTCEFTIGNAVHSVF